MTAYVLSGVSLPDGATTDLHVADGHLVDEAPSGAERVDCSGLLALPGLVDVHTHLREPGREDAETVASGARAAARGGFTAVLAMANTQPVTDTAEKAEHIHDLGLAAGVVDVQVIGAITKGLRGEELAELGLMHRSRAGVTMFSDDGMCVQDASLMRKALEWVRPFDGVIAQHSQEATLAGPGACCHEGELSGRLGLGGWPPVAESVIIARDVMLAEATGSRLHVCHITTAEGVEVVRWAKARGINVTAEVTPHHLLLGTEELVDYDTVYKVNPPLRTSEHIEALRAALADGTIDAVATDHAPHAPQDKDHAFVDARPGMLGLEQALSVVIETMVKPGRLDWAGVADRMSHTPARIARLAGHGRPLAVGEPANLVLVDPERMGTVDRDASASLSRNNPYHGRLLPDPVVATYLRGRETYRRA
ncbi:dihydroorotase [Tessaracoccus lapidicaptus]|uniref:Dihydroorotase n=1 Tax=Tessaracoccus lapidicaptus TaxID=1427523 RepID=A0A1C0AQY8_9ACTN|nr:MULTISPECIES: dihydroorotase [Tessaracoccus]AQX15093.1 dihydroorotase [Tessaracoccus sp. T2.5-30]OCL36595.1 dihydroorotase [Tessaracoccus lapidicaptus]VEP39287.1 Dihydroorotase [Tessaracoccus lapidicaptus]